MSSREREVEQERETVVLCGMSTQTLEKPGRGGEGGSCEESTLLKAQGSVDVGLTTTKEGDRRRDRQTDPDRG